MHRVSISINGSSSMVILVVYIPPYTSSFDFEHYFEMLSSMHEIHEDKVIVLGDFNTPTFSTNVYNRSATVLRNFQGFVNFGQYNSILNTSQRILDLVLLISIAKCSNQIFSRLMRILIIRLWIYVLYIKPQNL
jgi:hypothetical protein